MSDNQKTDAATTSDEFDVEVSDEDLEIVSGGLERI